MRVLLDTCTFVWMATESGRVSALAKEVFADPDNEVFLSVVSCWEIAVKHSAGKLRLPEPPLKFVPAYRERYAIQSLPLDEESALHAGRLPRLHADPFDRMLICQSITQSMPILTPDELIAQYPIRTIW